MYPSPSKTCGGGAISASCFACMSSLSISPSLLSTAFSLPSFSSFSERECLYNNNELKLMKDNNIHFCIFKHNKLNVLLPAKQLEFALSNYINYQIHQPITKRIQYAIGSYPFTFEFEWLSFLKHLLIEPYKTPQSLLR